MKSEVIPTKSGPALTRRAFLAGGTATALATAGWMAAVPRGARAAASPNETIGVGLIGCGDRGRALMAELLTVGGRHNVRMAAVCDVWRPNLDRAAGEMARRQDASPARTTRFRELLARTDVDAVIIATPDFSHGAVLVAALEAGKDVYIEKPMTLDLVSANRAVDLALTRERIVQVGTQRRSEGRFRAAARWVEEGAMGRISRVTAEINFNHARWLRPIEDCVEADVDWEAYLLGLPGRPFDPALLRRWQLFRETSNGIPGLWMTHYADAVHMLTGATYPSAAVALGGIHVWRDGREHADTFRAALEYPEGFLFTWGMGLGNAHGVQFTIHGLRATLDVESWRVIPERGVADAPEARTLAGEPGRGHVEDWVACLRSRGPTRAPIGTGHQHVVATVMAAQALETGRRQRYDTSRRTIFEG